MLRSFHNAMKRTMGRLDLAEEDLEVYETEHLTSCATIVAIDISHSMVLYGEDRITPAKKVALALTELITTKYPKDYLGVILFGDQAQEVKLSDHYLQLEDGQNATTFLTVNIPIDKAYKMFREMLRASRKFLRGWKNI